LARARPGPGHRTFALAKTKDRGHRLLGWNLDHPRDLIRPQLSFQELTLLLQRQFVKGRAACSANLSIERLAATLGNKHEVRLAIPLRVGQAVVSLAQLKSPLGCAHQATEGDLTELPERSKLFWSHWSNQRLTLYSNSYWQTMRRIDSRVSSVAAWEEESRKDPFFPLQVKWQPVGKAAGEVMEEMLSAIAPAHAPASAMELVQLVSLCPKSNHARKWPFSLSWGR
jgi:hypothetical protein